MHVPVHKTCYHDLDHKQGQDGFVYRYPSLNWWYCASLDGYRVTHKELGVSIKCTKKWPVHHTNCRDRNSTSFWQSKLWERTSDLVVIEEKDDTQVGSHCWTVGYTAGCICRCSSCKLQCVCE